MPSTKTVSSNQRVACRKFIYLPIGPRLKRKFGNITLCELMISHAQLTRDSVTIMCDIHDSLVWRQEYSTDGFFQGDKRGFSLAYELDGVNPFYSQRSVLAYELDGVNPFHSQRSVYSMTPMMMLILNLAQNIRNLFENIVLLGIIHGNGRWSSNSAAYLEIIVDEMLTLNGSSMYSAYDNASFTVT